MNQSVPVYTGSCWNPSIDEFRGYSVDWIVTLLGVDVVISTIDSVVRHAKCINVAATTCANLKKERRAVKEQIKSLEKLTDQSLVDECRVKDQ